MGRRHAAREREQLIEAVRTSGQPVKAVAERLGVSASTAYLWLKASRGKAKPQFVRLVPEAPERAASLVIRVGDVAIEVDAGFDAELLRTVVSALVARVA
jgi:transposase-like protein